MKKFYASIIAVLASACSSGDPGLFGPSSSGAGGMSSASSSAGPTSGMGGVASSSASTSASSSVSSDGSSSSSGGGFYWKSGVQQNVAKADMTGWTECYSGLYADTNVSMAGIVAGCPGSKLALGCRQKGAAGFQVMAMGAKADATFAFPKADMSSTHEANGVGWYMTGQQWGFVPAGDLRAGSAFDVTGISPAVPGPDGDKRVSWSADGFGVMQVGYRCGFDCYENHPGFDYSYERVALSAP